MDFLELTAPALGLAMDPTAQELPAAHKPRRHEEATPWLFAPAQVAKKAANQLAADHSLFDGLF